MEVIYSVGTLTFHIIFGKIIKKLSRVSSWLNPARFFRYKVSGTYLTRPQRLELWLTGLEPVVLPIIRKAQIKVTNGIWTHIRRNHNPLHCQVCHSHNAAHRIRTCKPFRTNGFQDRSLTTRTCSKIKSRRLILPFNRNQSGYLYIHNMLPVIKLIRPYGRIFTYEFPPVAGGNLHTL